MKNISFTQAFLFYVIAAVVVTAIASLAGCMPLDPNGTQSTTSMYVARHIDSEAGVVCWAYNWGGKVGGISCLPIKDTELSQ